MLLQHWFFLLKCGVALGRFLVFIGACWALCVCGWMKLFGLRRGSLEFFGGTSLESFRGSFGKKEMQTSSLISLLLFYSFCDLVQLPLVGLLNIGHFVITPFVILLF